MPLKRRKAKVIYKKPNLVVGIGASAGSVKALKGILSDLSAMNKGTACVVIQHLDESGGEISLQVIKTASKFPVVEVKRGVRLEAGKIYWVPPHTRASVRKDIFHTETARTVDQKLSVIDHAFSSIGEEFESATVGVILSGKASDGALGLKRINESGGLTIVQSPTTAEHKSMPESAIAIAPVDYILPPKDIAEAIKKNAGYLSRIDNDNDSIFLKEQIAKNITIICEVLFKQTKQDFKHYKTSTLVRRIQRRMQVIQIDSIERYIDRLAKDKEEAETLFKELLINVTCFFRDPLAFEALKEDVLKKLVEECSPDQKIRIWVPGCSTGEEPYTIAILMAELVANRATKPEIQIIATDIDPHALSIARKGSYPPTIANFVPAPLLSKYFAKRGGRYHVNKELRELCLFSNHNLINDPPFSQLDLISCRNLIIYLGLHLQKKLFAVFHYALKKNGYLFLGTSESLTSHKELFKTVNGKHRIAQRKTTALKVPQGIANSVHSYIHHIQDLPKDPEVNIAMVSQRIALDEIPLKYLVVNDEGHIISSSEGIGKYIEISAGPFHNSLIKLSKPSLRASLRKAFTLAKKEKRKVIDESSTLKTEDGFERVGIIVQPMPQLGEETGLYWVAFQYLGKVYKTDPNYRPANVTDHELIDQLEREVFVLREDLDKTVQDLEASNEELKSSNEELLSMNEELQSANEELETSKEEVQMANEALHQTNADLENLLAGTQIATLFLDENLRIRGFTPSISQIYRIQHSDLGRDIRDFSSFAVKMPAYPQPRDLVDHETFEDELTMPNGTVFQRRILAYKGYNQLKDGLVVAFIDVTKLRMAEKQYRELADSMPNIIWTTTPDGFTDYLNERWYEYTSYDRSLRGQDSWLPILHPDDVQKTLELRQHSLKNRTPFEIEYRFWDKKNSMYRWFLGRIVPVFNQDGSLKKWVGTATDINDRKIAEEKRRESEKLFQLVADSAPVLIWIADKNRNRTWCNNVWTDFTGQSTQEALQDGWRQKVHPDDLNRYLEIYQEHANSKTSFYIEYRLRTKDGTYRWIGARGVPRYNSIGEYLGYIGACIDIHEQKLAREVLAETRKNLELMIRTSPSFMCILSTDQFVFEQANEQFQKLIGHRDILGKSLAEALPEIKNQGFIQILQRVRQTGETYIGTEMPALLQRTPHGPLEKRYVDFVYQSHESVEGKTEKIFVHGVDVTEKVVNRRLIDNERANFRNLFKQTPEMVCILSGPEHMFEFVNEAHVKVLGFDATGKTVRQAQPESVEVHGILDDVYRTGVTAELHEIAVTVADRIRYFNLTYAARRDEEGQINGVMILGTEVTDEVLSRNDLEKAKKEAETANQSKTQFLANMSHEIRTPLAAIVGFSDLLHNKLSGQGEVDDFVDRISRNAKVLGRLIDELLDLSKIEADKLEVEQVPVNVDSLIQDVHSTIQLRAEAKGLHLNFKWLTEKPDTITTDPVRVSQVLTNVIGNAVKFTERGSIEVAFSVSDSKLKVLISDTGIGLTPEQQKRIFEPFTQGDASVSRKFGGTGLGLTLSKRLAQLLGGDLRLIKSVPYEGTVFEFTLQLQKTKKITESSAPENVELKPDLLKARKILIVDDSPDNRFIVSLYLKQVGSETAEAVNGVECIEITSKDQFDLILMDIQMPVMDGYQAVKELKKRGLKTPIVALTAHALKEERERCMAAGFDGYVTKPINKSNLFKSVLACLNRS